MKDILLDKLISYIAEVDLSDPEEVSDRRFASFVALAQEFIKASSKSGDGEKSEEEQEVEELMNFVAGYKRKKK